MPLYVELALRVEHETKKAVLVEDGDAKVWIPKVHIEDLAAVPMLGGFCELSVKEWFALENGLI